VDRPQGALAGRHLKTYVVKHPLPEAEVFASSRGWHIVRQALIVEVVSDDGLSGFGETYGPAAVSRTLVDEDVRNVRAVRAAIGPDRLLAMDANQAYDAGQAIRFGRKVEESHLTKPRRRP